MSKKVSKNNTNKKIKILISLVALVLIFSVVIYNSYSYYITSSDNTLAIGGTAFVSGADINLKIYLEDKNASGNGIGTYSRQYFIPTANYTYNSSKTACTKGITIKDFSNGQFNIEAENKGWCKVYFDAVDGVISDSSFNLYVEQTQGQGDYKQEGRLPDDLNTYVLDTSKTKCTGQGAASASLSITNREIYLTTNGDVTCEIYAKISTTNSSYATLSSTVISLAGSDKTSTQDGSIYQIINDYGYRYRGTAPDNYISFNGELWRIIGVFDGTDLGMKSGNYYSKIILDEGITESVNTLIANDYVNSSLNNYLNGEYYNSLNSVAKSQIISATWHLGATGARMAGYDGQVDETEYIEYERGSLLGYNASTIKTQAKVGMMYTSDYVYASTSWNRDEDYDDKNWLHYDQTEKILGIFNYYNLGTADSGGTYRNGLRRSYDPDTVNGEIFRPAVYLDTSVVIIGGTGTKTNPYRIK